MAWIELHQARQRHPKTLRLAALLGKERRYACGLLDDLWTWALDVADKGGCLPGLAAEDVAVALDYPRKKGGWLMDALVKSGYVDVGEDGGYSLHDWAEYAGRLNDRREKDAIRKKEVRKKSAKCPQDVRRTSDGCPGVTVPNRTVPYLTVPNEEDTAAGGAARARATPSGGLSGGATGGVAYLTSHLPPLTPGNRSELDALMATGFEHFDDQLLVLAVDEAAAHDGLTWSYVRKILLRWANEGITTVDQARADQAGRKQQRPSARAAPGVDPRIAAFEAMKEREPDDAQ